jgi:hypothetical protein
MRRLGFLCLFASASLSDPLVEVASTQFVGSQVDLAAIAVGDGYIPSVISQREPGRGHWRSMTLGLASADQTKFDGVASGMDRHGGGVLLAIRQGDELKAIEFRYEGRETRSIDQGTLPLGGLANARLLRVASLRDGPLLVVAHDGGLTLGAVKPRGRGRTDVIPGPFDAVAASEPFALGRDGRLSIFVVAPGRIIQLTQAADAFAFAAQQAFVADGFVPRAIAGEGMELWVAGEKAGRATLLRFDPRSLVTPPVALDLGAGVAEKLRFLGPNELAVAGSKDGRAWVGVLALGRRPAVVHEAYLKGALVTALATNPARKGWTLAAATPDSSVHLLRLRADAALPRDWDPFAPPPAPQAPQVPIPEPEPPPEAMPPVEVKGGGGGGGGHQPASAVLPRAEAVRGGAADTEIILINLGGARMQLHLRFVADEGRGGFARVTVEPGKRTKVSIAQTLFQHRWAGGDFDGYVRIEGGDRDCLVVDAVIRRQGQPPEEVRPHWR